MALAGISASPTLQAERCHATWGVAGASFSGPDPQLITAAFDLELEVGELIGKFGRDAHRLGGVVVKETGARHQARMFKFTFGPGRATTGLCPEVQPQQS